MRPGIADLRLDCDWQATHFDIELIVLTLDPGSGAEAHRQSVPHKSVGDPQLVPGSADLIAPHLTQLVVEAGDVVQAVENGSQGDNALQRDERFRVACG